MAVFSLTRDKLHPLEETTFAKAGLSERSDLQRLLRDQISAVAPGILIISEEFGHWEGSSRRIDLLGIDQDANIVIVELKRTEDGGHMDLQALRYAAMVSTMTFDQAVESFSRYLTLRNDVREPRQALLEHLGWDEPDVNLFGHDVRIVLASADFHPEVTTTVLWLNQRGLDIRCVRMKPYSDGEKLIVDIQQVIPLPEAADYQVRIRAKEQLERQARQERGELSEYFQRFWGQLLRVAESKKAGLHAGRSASTNHVQGQPAGAPVPGLYLRYVLGKGHARVLLALYGERGKAAFDELYKHRLTIEETFGDALEWERRDGQQLSRICFRMPSESVRNESAWPSLIERLVGAMIRLEAALRPQLDQLQIDNNEIG